MQLPSSFYASRKLVDVVENQTSYYLEDTAMHIFETHAKAESVHLQFDSFVLASMFKGKKIMHLEDKPSFDFLPGESLILQANAHMCIDFPEARENKPTSCLAMEIGKEQLTKVIDFMNEQMTRPDDQEWSLMDYNFHFTNDQSIYQILQRLVYLYTENHPAKESFVANMIQELIIRILQVNTCTIFSHKAKDCLLYTSDAADD